MYDSSLRQCPLPVSRMLRDLGWGSVTSSPPTGRLVIKQQAVLFLPPWPGHEGRKGYISLCCGDPAHYVILTHCYVPMESSVYMHRYSCSLVSKELIHNGKRAWCFCCHFFKVMFFWNCVICTRSSQNLFALFFIGFDHLCSF